MGRLPGSAEDNTDFLHRDALDQVHEKAKWHPRRTEGEES